METGIYAGISNADYHGGPGISKSGLDQIARSPLHYWSRYLDPQRTPTEQTASMRLGTAIHTAVLEPDQFNSRYVTVPDDAPRKPTSAQLNAKKPSDDTIAAIAWWDRFNAERGDREIIDQADAATCSAIAQVVRQHPTARKVFATGQAEMSCYWTDRETGLLCKCRPDWLALPFIVDLKSTEDASADAFQRSAWNWRYWVQAAWYIDGVEQATGQRPDAFVFGAFEKSPPYACAFYYADQAMIDMGRAEYRRLLRILADCMSTDRWPGYDTDVRPLGLPAWAIKAANDNQRGAA